MAADEGADGRGRAQGKPGPAAGLPSNALSLGEATYEQFKKLAESRGIPVEKLIAQLVQQYLQEP